MEPGTELLGCLWCLGRLLDLRRGRKWTPDLVFRFTIGLVLSPRSSSSCGINTGSQVTCGQRKKPTSDLTRSVTLWPTDARGRLLRRGSSGARNAGARFGSKRVIAAIRRPERITTIRLVARNPSHGGVAGVEGERRLPVGFGLDDAAAGPGVRRRARRSAGVVAIDVLEQEWRHALVPREMLENDDPQSFTSAVEASHSRPVAPARDAFRADRVHCGRLGLVRGSCFDGRDGRHIAFVTLTTKCRRGRT